jgi:hypothetical protein
VELGYSNAIGLGASEANTYDDRIDWDDPMSSALQAGMAVVEGAPGA